MKRLTEQRDYPLTMSMWAGESKDLRIYNRLAEIENILGDDYDLERLKELVNATPTIHSYWIKYPRPHYFKCANCKYTVPYRKACLHNEKREYNYCPSCGAKMDLEEK